MIIHNPILTGSFSVNGADLSTITGSVATSASFDARTTYLESTSSILTAASASQSVTSGSLVAASSSLSATSGSLSAASGSFNTRVSALEVTGSALSSSLLTVSGSGYATSASLSAASGSFNTRVATIESKYATTGSNTFIGTQVVSGSILQSGSFTSTGTLTAQTLVIQTITSSVVYSSGSNVFGNSLGNSQVFTGSVLITGSLALAGNITSNGTAVVLGSGTSGYLPKFTGASAVGNSSASDNGTTFDVSIQGKFTGGSGARNLTLNAPTDGGSLTFETGGTAYADMGSNKAILGTGSATNFYLGTRAGSSLALGTANVARLFLDASGNLGLGVTPSAWYSTGYNIKALQIGSAGALFNLDVTSSNLRLYLSNNAYVESVSAAQTYIVTGAASQFSQENGAFFFYQAASGTANTPITFTQAMTLTAAGNLGIGSGATSPLSKLDVRDASAVMGNYQTIQAFSTDSAAINLGGGISLGGYYTSTTSISQFASIVGRKENSTSGNYDGYLAFGTNSQATGVRETMRLTSSGNLGIGTTGPQAKLHISCTANFGAILKISDTTTESTGIIALGDGNTSVVNVGIWRAAANCMSSYGNWLNLGGYDGILFATCATGIGSQAERMRITNTGDVFIGTTTTGAGERLIVAKSEAAPLALNRLSSDGGILRFYQDSTEEGNVSVAGATVSYNSFLGSHWSQLQDGSKPTILKGTILEAIDELCVWENETNDRLPKSKISDTIESKNVYGIFLAWDEEWESTNDFFVAAVGLGYIRVHSSQNVTIGDLLQSNGDGTAKIQSDSIMRSSTIAKVVSTQKIETYEDGSYLIAATLHCG